MNRKYVCGSCLTVEWARMWRKDLSVYILCHHFGTYDFPSLQAGAASALLQDSTDTVAQQTIRYFCCPYRKRKVPTLHARYWCDQATVSSQHLCPLRFFLPTLIPSRGPNRTGCCYASDTDPEIHQPERQRLQILSNADVGTGSRSQERHRKVGAALSEHLYAS